MLSATTTSSSASSEGQTASPMICRLCNFSSGTPATFREHFRSDHHLCKLRERVKSQLTEDNANIHNSNHVYGRQEAEETVSTWNRGASAPYICTICRKTFKSETTHLAHLNTRRHTQGKARATYLEASRRIPRTEFIRAVNSGDSSNSEEDDAWSLADTEEDVELLDEESTSMENSSHGESLTVGIQSILDADGIATLPSSRVIANKVRATEAKKRFQKLRRSKAADKTDDNETKLLEEPSEDNEVIAKSNDQVNPNSKESLALTISVMGGHGLKSQQNNAIYQASTSGRNACIPASAIRKVVKAEVKSQRSTSKRHMYDYQRRGIEANMGMRHKYFDASAVFGWSK